MTTYSYGQLMQLWINNGGSKATAALAAAIAEAESGGRSDAKSPNPDGGTNVGPWQLDTPGGGGAGFSVQQLQDPNTNAAAAVRASGGGTDWSTWAAYVSGAYKPFLSNSAAPDPNVPVATLTSASGSSGGADNPASCLIGGGEGGVFGIGSASFCLLSKSEARAMIGAGLLVGAVALIALPGIILLGAAAFSGAGGARAIGQAAGPLEAAPGYGQVIRTVRSRSENRAARQSGARSERIRQQRAAGRQAQKAPAGP